MITWIKVGPHEHEAHDADTGEYLSTIYRLPSGRWGIADDGGPATMGGKPLRVRTVAAAKQVVEAYWDDTEWEDDDDAG